MRKQAPKAGCRRGKGTQCRQSVAEHHDEKSVAVCCCTQHKKAAHTLETKITHLSPGSAAPLGIESKSAHWWHVTCLPDTMGSSSTGQHWNSPCKTISRISVRLLLSHGIQANFGERLFWRARERPGWRLAGRLENRAPRAIPAINNERQSGRGGTCTCTCTIPSIQNEAHGSTVTCNVVSRSWHIEHFPLSWLAHFVHCTYTVIIGAACLSQYGRRRLIGRGITGRCCCCCCRRTRERQPYHKSVASRRPGEGSRTVGQVC